MNNKIIYYDSQCGLCNITVRLILHIDDKKKFCFSPISLLFEKKKNMNCPDSIILSINNKLYFEGRAIIGILKNLDFGWRLFGKLLEYIPIVLIDKTYRIIAINRKRVMFNKKKSCYNIPYSLRNRFIFDKIRDN